MPSPVKERDSLNWWVACKHPDGENEFAQVHQFENFNPKSKTDFKSGFKYNLKTSKWNPSKRIERYRVYILRIEGELQAVGYV